MSYNPLRYNGDPMFHPMDRVTLGGDLLPGRADVGKPKRTWKWDKKEAAGTLGDSITYRGSRLVDFAIELTFWEADQIDAWDVVRPKIEPDGKTALDVKHPVLDRANVHAVVVAEIVPLWHQGKGEFRAQIGILEYRPPPKANPTKTPDGSKAGADKDGRGAAAKAPTAKTAQEIEIERLLAEARKP